jgi:deazaflavin-dependent oxidoreductase (nitroreductase family)
MVCSDIGDLEATEKRMADEAFNRALEVTREIELTVTGRSSGREITIPVWFAREGDQLYLVPVRGSDADWYKNVPKTPTIRLAAGGAQLSARATPVTDAAEVAHILDLFRARYGARDVEAYYPKQDVAVEVRGPAHRHAAPLGSARARETRGGLGRSSTTRRNTSGRL